MAELTDLLELKHYPRFRLIHDCVDTGSDQAINSTPILYPCDCAVRDYRSDGSTALFADGNIKDSIENAAMTIKLAGVLNGPINTIVLIDISIPHPTFGTITVETLDYTIKKNNTDVPFSLNTEVYNAIDGEAHLYGFDIHISSDSAATLKGRSVYVRT